MSIWVANVSTGVDNTYMDTKKQLLTDLANAIDGAKVRGEWLMVERYTSAWHRVNGAR